MRSQVLDRGYANFYEKALFELFGPEVYANFALEAHPVTSMEKIGELFQRWATEGR